MDDLFEQEMQAAIAGLQTDQSDERKVRMHKRQRRVEMRRATADQHLAEIWPEKLEPSTSYHFISGGDVDSLSYLLMLVQRHRIDYLMFSTWCMALPDVLQIQQWIDQGAIGRVDAYCGEIFPSQYSDEHALLVDVVRPTGGRVAVFRNHAKLFVGFGPDLGFVVESSANINTNPRTEQAALHIDRGLALFYKQFYDGIKSYNRDFDAWQPLPEEALP
ncbi:MAG: hypothetical protein L0H83_04360 [Salinisphaera sp.]|nr:hypothetical protein [Salinisphaera sp.]